MACIVTLFSVFIAIIHSWPLPGSALVHTPWQVAGDSEDLVGSQCRSPIQENALLQINGTISSILAELKTVPQCGDGLWYRVAYLNMNDSTQQCPPNWMEINTPVRTCGRPTSMGASCASEYFSTRSLQYSKICGRAIGYQDGTGDAFNSYGRSPPSSPDDNYVDGVSMTHGMPRTHIWTFAVGGTETVENSNSNVLCPCASSTDASNTHPPSFVGDNYFCESGNAGRQIHSRTEFFEDDPVWDGEQCEGECCSNGKTPPWFSVTLPSPTSDDIEVRICGDEGTQNEDSPIQLLEIFIQ